MDAIELARQIAADLHAQAVERGTDPWNPYAFVVAEANRRDLDVEKVAPGAAILDGGRAKLIAGDSLIVHENIGSAFEQAFLVAHEIGHAELGDGDDDDIALNIDPARSSEASPVGLDRVVDYGRRQRREVQMDLFAREFLLPRPVAFQLHVGDRLTASDIAQRLGAPFEVIAQQLLDALLLPAIASEPEPLQPQRPLNCRQAAAARHRGKAYLLEAGPGTGKTQTLIGRVQSLLAEGVDPRRILLLTFSNKAASEMAERISRQDKQAAAAMWIGTFHAFGLDLIRRFHEELGLPKDPRMMDRTEAVELLEEEFPSLNLVHYRNLYDPTQIIADMLSAISRAKDEVVDPDQYAILAKAMLERATSADETEAAERALEVARVYAAYEALKRSTHRIDFGDLVAMPVRLLEENEGIRAHLQTQYEHVLVDEYQDVNRSSIRLLTALRGDGHNLWAVGDVKQSIYRFRGASSFNIARFGKKDFVGGRRGRLKRNYRSTAPVVQAFSEFASGMRVAGLGSGLVSDRKDAGLPPELWTVNVADQQTVALTESIKQMNRAGYPYRDQAILCTGNDKLSLLGADLERLGVPVLFLGSLFERPEVKDLLSLLTILSDPRAVGLIRIACWPEFSMSIEEVDRVFGYLKAREGLATEWLYETDRIEGVSEACRESLRTLAAALEGFDATSHPWRVLVTILLDRTRIAARIGASGEVADRSRGIAIWQLINFIRAQPSGKGLAIARLLDRIRKLVRLGDDRDLRQLPAAAQGINAIRLMTIHAAKGLEFPVVHLPGMNSDTLPRAYREGSCPPPDGMIAGADGRSNELLDVGHQEEQECLFYVALSRAKDRLFLYAPIQKANGHKRSVSPFLNRLGPNLIRLHHSVSDELPKAPDQEDISLAVEGSLNFSAQQIALYESCPRRFFYTHILQTGGRRSTTAFMQMHEAVRVVVDEIRAPSGQNNDDDDSLESKVVRALVSHGLADHGYANQYRDLALMMVRFFLSSREGLTPELPTEISVSFGGEQIIVTPDDVLVAHDGTRIVRRVRTGHRRTTETKDVGAAAFVMAAQQEYLGARIELVHLSDIAITALDLSARELQGRREKLQGYLTEIRAGQFPANGSSRTCPNCPAFFVCGEVPLGTLEWHARSRE
ncbi:UvrD-helicase domain-containing protein [Cupriavidus metallidurans]|jgi:superfamily I DNA/RNA helicase|uniref:UvrD-helicase domain-containing protein n=1 Tax=Cupriavidus metallidurans TaxID=119219 RepID=UPI00078695BC|nr:UvrD-helicase domain-containing protein [Cupriavidus metallidurans]